MANDVQKLEKFYEEQIHNQVTFQIGDIVVYVNANSRRSFPMLIVFIAEDPNDDEPIRVIFFDEDEDIVSRWFAPHQLVLLKRLGNIG